MSIGCLNVYGRYIWLRITTIRMGSVSYINSIRGIFIWYFLLKLQSLLLTIRALRRRFYHFIPDWHFISTHEPLFHSSSSSKSEPAKQQTDQTTNCPHCWYCLAIVSELYTITILARQTQLKHQQNCSVHYRRQLCYLYWILNFLGDIQSLQASRLRLDISNWRLLCRKVKVACRNPQVFYLYCCQHFKCYHQYTREWVMNTASIYLYR